MVLRNSFTQGMLKNMYKYYFETYDQKSTVYDQIYAVEPSDAAWEQSTSVVGMGKLAEKPEGEPIKYSQPQEGFTTYGKNKTFADGVEISMEAVDDHQRIDSLLQATAATWGSTVRNTREEYYSRTFNYGGYTGGHDHFKNIISGVLSQNADGLVYDAKPLFNLSNNTRTAKSGSTYYNGLALALSQPNLITAWLQMVTTNNRNERGEVISLRPDILLVPPALEPAARVILQSTNLPGTVNNDINVAANLVRLVSWDYLSSTTAWFLVCSKQGLIAQNRKDPVIDFYQDEDTKTYKANIIARWGHRVDNWRFVVGSNFATS